MSQRNIALDLLRSIAILMVFIGHTVLSYGSPIYLSPLQFGGTGVDLFFVLSGWLIGYQLFNELKHHKNIEIKRFWVRRWMRTLPAYYAVLAFTIAQQYLTKDNVTFPIEHLLFLQNYQQPLTLFTISWSLCVEEQFYLFIAPLIALLTKVSTNKRTLILIVFLLLPSIFRELDWYNNLNETHVRWDCCIMGVLLANIYFGYPKLWKKLLEIATPVSLISLVIYLSFYYFRWNPEYNISDPSKLILALIFGTWILWANKAYISFNRPLNAIVYYVSSRSYAIYLLHPDALAIIKRIPIELPFIAYIVLAFLLTSLFSEFLYRLIEQPIMKARSKFSFAQARSNTRQKNCNE